MRDWVAYVRAHLGDGKRSEVIEELGNHFEETYLSLRGQGIGEEEARKLTESEVQNWRELNEEIIRAKEGDVRNSFRQVCIPGLVTFFGAAVALVVVGKLGVEPRAFVAMPLPPVLFYVPWLAALPVIGALGAFLAKRADARGIGVHVSSTFPAILMAIAMATTLTIILLVQGRTPPALTPGMFAAAAMSWVFVPGGVLLAGDMLFQWLYKRQEPSRYK